MSDTMKASVTPNYYAWVETYSDIGPCIELCALYDDALKKNPVFLYYAILLAQRIAEDLELDCKVTAGKWGARLETAKNPKMTRTELEACAKAIVEDTCWKALAESTWVFTYGKYDEDWKNE